MHGRRRNENVQNLTGNITAAARQQRSARASPTTAASRELKGLLPALNGTDPVGTNYSKSSKFPNLSTSGNMDWVASPKLPRQPRGRLPQSDQHDTNVTEEPLFIFSGSNNIDFLDTPASLQHGTGFTSIPSNTKVTRDQQTRLYFQADSTVYARAGGEHQIKFGIQADTTGNNVLRGESRNRVTIRWNGALSTGVPVTRGTYGYYSVRSNAVAPKQGLITEGDIRSTMLGFFFQDAWTINNKLTVNLGVRTERERVPTFTTGRGHSGIRPRVRLRRQAGAARRLRLRHQGRRQVEGVRFVGRLLRHFKLELPRGSFGGDKWLEVLLHARHLQLSDAGGRRQLPARVQRHDHPWRADRGQPRRRHRLPSPVVRRGLDRTGSEADAPAGGHRRASTTS